MSAELSSDISTASLVKYLRREAEKNLRHRTEFAKQFGKHTGGAHYVKRARKLHQAADLIERLTLDPTPTNRGL